MFQIRTSVRFKMAVPPQSDPPEVSGFHPICPTAKRMASSAVTSSTKEGCRSSSAANGRRHRIRRKPIGRARARGDGHETSGSVQTARTAVRSESRLGPIRPLQCSASTSTAQRSPWIKTGPFLRFPWVLRSFRHSAGTAKFMSISGEKRRFTAPTAVD